MRQFTGWLMLTLVAANGAFAFPSWEAVGVGSHDVNWTPGGTGTLAVAGTFGGTTVTFFWCAPLPGAEECFEVNAAACTFVSRGTCDFFRGPGRLRLVVTGGSPSIDAVAAGPTQATVGVGGSGGVTGLLEGPITFGDAAGALDQQPLFFYDAPLNNLGIGTASPQTNTHISESNSDTTPTMEIEQLSTGDAALQFSILGDAYAIGIDNSDDRFKISYAVTAGTAVLGTNDVLAIDRLGNIGIGTNIPTQPLHVVDGIAGSIPLSSDDLIVLLQRNATAVTNSALSLLSGTAGNATLLFSDADDEDAGRLDYDHSNNSLTFHTSAVEQLRITANGRVGIGTIDPQTKFEIDTPSGNGYFSVTNVTDGDIFSIDTAGNIGIGTNTPSTKLSMGGIAPKLSFVDIGATGDQGILFADSGGGNRFGLLFTAGGIVALANRASNGVVNIRANTSTAGVPGEITVLVISESGLDVTDGLTLGFPSSTSPPVTCSAAVDGHLYWDSVQSLVCKCDSVTWAGVGGGATCV